MHRIDAGRRCPGQPLTGTNLWLVGWQQASGVMPELLSPIILGAASQDVVPFAKPLRCSGSSANFLAAGAIRRDVRLPTARRQTSH